MEKQMAGTQDEKISRIVLLEILAMIDQEIMIEKILR
jgi:hypothetical protein